MILKLPLAIIFVLGLLVTPVRAAETAFSDETGTRIDVLDATLNELGIEPAVIDSLARKSAEEERVRCVTVLPYVIQTYSVCVWWLGDGSGWHYNDDCHTDIVGVGVYYRLGWPNEEVIFEEGVCLDPADSSPVRD